MKNNTNKKENDMKVLENQRFSVPPMVESKIPSTHSMGYNNYKNNLKNNSNNKINLISLFSILILILLSSFVFAIPDSLTLQGKLTDLSGSSQKGTFNFTFRIYDASTNGETLYQIINRSVTTDVNGIYDVILYNLSSLNFSDQYYLGITVQGDNESKPRINLTSTPYSFRANISEDLNPENRYKVLDINVTEKLTVNNTLFVVDSLVGIGTPLPYNILTVVGSVSISGSLNASSINVTGNLLTSTLNVTSTTENATFEGGVKIIGTLYGGSPLKIGGGINISGVPSGQDALIILNASGDKVFSINELGSINISGPGNTSFDGTTLFIDAENNLVGIGTISPNDALEVVGSVRVSGSLNASFINATQIRQGTNLVQTINAVFNIGNLTRYSHQKKYYQH